MWATSSTGVWVWSAWVIYVASDSSSHGLSRVWNYNTPTIKTTAQGRIQKRTHTRVSTNNWFAHIIVMIARIWDNIRNICKALNRNLYLIVLTYLRAYAECYLTSLQLPRTQSKAFPRLRICTQNPFSIKFFLPLEPSPAWLMRKGGLISLFSIYCGLI